MAKASDNDVKRDEVLKRMLHTPHKPHVAKKKTQKARPKKDKTMK